MIQRVGWCLLMEWWCYPVTATPAEIVAAIRKETIVPGPVEDRCFGGFRCAEEGNRHLAFLTGMYSYIGGEMNLPLTPEDRQTKWKRLIADNTGKDGFIGGGPFCEDAPAAAEEGESK